MKSRQEENDLQDWLQKHIDLNLTEIADDAESDRSFKKCLKEGKSE